MKIELGALETLPRDRGIRVTVGETRVAVFRVADEVFAVGDRCSHAEASLAEGEVYGTEVECPRHGSEFDLRTGQPISLPATRDDMSFFPQSLHHPGKFADSLETRPIRQPLMMHPRRIHRFAARQPPRRHAQHHIQRRVDDRPAARRPGDEHELAVPRHDGRRHRAQHAFARRDEVGVSADVAVEVGRAGDTELASFSPLSDVIATGTFWMFSERLCAVTMISSLPTVASAPGLPWAAAAVVEIDAASPAPAINRARIAQLINKSNQSDDAAL